MGKRSVGRACITRSSVKPDQQNSDWPGLRMVHRTNGIIREQHCSFHGRLSPLPPSHRERLSLRRCLCKGAASVYVEYDQPWPGCDQQTSHRHCWTAQTIQLCSGTALCSRPAPTLLKWTDPLRKPKSWVEPSVNTAQSKGTLCLVSSSPSQPAARDPGFDHVPAYGEGPHSKRRNTRTSDSDIARVI